MEPIQVLYSTFIKMYTFYRRTVHSQVSPFITCFSQYAVDITCIINFDITMCVLTPHYVIIKNYVALGDV